MNTPISTIPKPISGRDYYTEFMECSRWLRKEQSDARKVWFDGLSWEHKEKTLFRFEMLLKGLVCFGNPGNHPGQPWKESAVVSKDLSIELDLVVSTIRNIVDTGRLLTANLESTLVFKRYIESVVANDQSRVQMVKKSLNQDTPEQSMALIISAMQNLQEMAENLALGDNISYRLFSAVIMTAQREVHRSEFFNPLTSFEFRAEFDRIKNPKVLHVLSRIESDTARRVVALTFLALFRLIQYLDLIGNENTSEVGFGPLFSFLALLKSDGREFAAFLISEAATWMSDGFGRQYQSLTPEQILEQYDALNLEFEELKSLRELFASTGNQLQLEIKKVFEQQLPALDQVEDQNELNQAIRLSTGSLRSFLQNAIVLIVKEFDVHVDGDVLFDDFTSDVTRSQRLRRDVWMFQQILRGFIAKTKGSASVTDQWAGMNTFKYVKTFVNYFRSMGYQLLRYSDYDRFDRFMMLVDRLRDGDVLEVQRLPQVIHECEDFHSYLEQMFESISRREELADLPFDRKDAAKTLKLFLGH